MLSKILHLHPTNSFLVFIWFEVVEVLPPLKQHGLTDQPEPWSEAKCLVLEHGLEFIRGDISIVFGFVGVDAKVNLGLGKEDVIN